MFYPINQYATFAREDDVGSFPINVATFRSLLKEKLKKMPSMTLAAFVGFMNSSFFNNIASDIYGFGSIYEKDPKTGKSQLRKKYEERQTKQRYQQKRRKSSRTRMVLALSRSLLNRQFKCILKQFPARTLIQAVRTRRYLEYISLISQLLRTAALQRCGNR
jgi:hypothetical protein